MTGKENLFDYDALMQRLKKYRSFGFLLLLLILTGNLVNALELPAKLLNIPKMYSFGVMNPQMQSDEEKLNQLTIGINLEFVNSLFGKPKFRHECASYEWDLCQKGVIQKIDYFENDNFLLEVFSNEKDKVIAYSIGSLNTHFKPKINIKFDRDTEMNSVRLGNTTFGELPQVTEGSWLRMQREGFISAHGDVSYYKYYYSNDYMASALYIFKLDEEYDAAAAACPDAFNVIEPMEPYYTNDFSIDRNTLDASQDALIEKRVDEMEKNCKIYAIAVIHTELDPKDFTLPTPAFL